LSPTDTRNPIEPSRIHSRTSICSHDTRTHIHTQTKTCPVQSSPVQRDEARMNHHHPAASVLFCFFFFLSHAASPEHQRHAHLCTHPGSPYPSIHPHTPLNGGTSTRAAAERRPCFVGGGGGCFRHSTGPYVAYTLCLALPCVPARPPARPVLHFAFLRPIHSRGGWDHCAFMPTAAKKEREEKRTPPVAAVNSCLSLVSSSSKHEPRARPRQMYLAPGYAAHPGHRSRSPSEFQTGPDPGSSGCYICVCVW
jgi:hypothetical protein